MTTQLRLYQGAARLIGERSISSLTEDTDARRVMDEIWADGFKSHVLEQGFWNFAMRTVEADYSTDITPEFGYSRAFDKPTDWVRTMEVACDEGFNAPLLAYVDEAGYWYCDLDTIYVKYVSNGDSYGGDLSRWPETFTRYAQTYLALEAAPRITDSETTIERLEKRERRLLLEARSKDGMNEAARKMPMGSWARARGGRGVGYRISPNLAV